jgi:hypothetical protein
MRPSEARSRKRLAGARLAKYSSRIPPALSPRRFAVRFTPLLVVALVAGPALAQPPKSDIDLALAKAKKEKKLVTMVFTQFG